MSVPQAAAPARSRGFSVKSEASRKSKDSGHKSHLSESSQEKARRSLQTKADPTVAMYELQPSEQALEKSNLGSLRSLRHKDQYGNVIEDPDKSNPTRPRLERPLDTIRSFEAAIYGTYSSQRPTSYARTEDGASQMGDFSRRTSYYGSNNYHNRGHSEQNGYYGRPSRPDADGYQNGGPSQGQENHYPYGNRRPRQQPRMPSEQGVYGNNVPYGPPTPNNFQQSYDNVTALSGSGSGSNNTDPYGNSTDPSSLNSSMDQLQQQALQQQRMEQRAQAEYGFQGFGSGPNLNNNGYPASPVAMDQGIAQKPVMTAQPSPSPATSRLRKNTNETNVAPPEKRKSWLKRRFSKD
ncbi:hypothetical protein N7468_009485 [Penicillium chermesinum]|uniref:DUF2406 domain-containing protein n=1 Tax=Penicillium chermesinum TaxID=63820 RepID=A0A9W9TF14_9EURO|nr:uncharacterized protein N7468_009485 [Penicillium chermesinum]KAJ5220281.1 hypothetical protein N7468_009485 [Penicillium chermesinum]KAJ6157724.1 hypothetical protein N7470_005316 [Penicillium chermesinum]